MKILVIQKKFMGDVLMSSVVFRALKQKFPNAEFHFLLSKSYSQVVDNHQFIDKFLFFDDKFSAIVAKIKRENYDVVIDLYSKPETAVLAFLSGAKRRIGFYKKYTQFLYTDPVKRRAATFPDLTTAIEHRLQLLEPLDIPLEPSYPEIFVTDAELQKASAHLDNLGIDRNRALIMISTFGSTPEKSYPYMAEFIENISKQTDTQILCNYLPSQKPDFEKLLQNINGEAKSHIIKDFQPEDLRTFMAVLSLCSANIGCEGGATNISKALNIPTFSIFAPAVGRAGWDWKETDGKNISVHLHDYKPESNNSEEFKPELFQDKLIDFLKNNSLY